MRVYAKVVADLFHHGHAEFFRAARALGSHLTVRVVPDDRVAAGKGRRPVMSTAERAAVVAACRHVDAVITDGPRVIGPGFMRERGLDLYAFGATDETELRRKLADCAGLPAAMVARVPYTREISTTEIIRRVRERAPAPG